MKYIQKFPEFINEEFILNINYFIKTFTDYINKNKNKERYDYPDSVFYKSYMTVKK